MQLSALVPLLEAITDLGEGRVGVAASIEDAQAEKINQPLYCWLTELQGQSEETRIIGAIRQHHEQRFTVLTMVYGVQDRTGTAALATMDALRAQIIQALLRQQPASTYDPIRHVRDAIAFRGDGRLYWLDQFITGHDLVA